MPDFPKPPSGSMPNDTVTLPDGRTVNLVSIARSACEQFTAEYPGYTERYGQPGMQ